MRHPTASFIPFLAAFAFLCAAAAAAGEAKRVAYFEAGPYWAFTHALAAFREEMAKNPDYDVSYPPELFFSPGWSAEPHALDAIAAALMARGDVDLLLVAGTRATQSVLRVNNGKIPIIAMELSDPLNAGIIKSADDSGIDNFTCEAYVDRRKQMIRVFHEVVNFSALGILYPAGPDGRLISGLDDAVAVAAEDGFRVLAYEIPDESADSCAAGLRRLHENGADAFFVGALNCFDWEQSDPAPLFELLNRVYHMPTFARDGSPVVQGGALMGFTTWDHTESAARFADKAARIFAGATPRSLPLRTDTEPRISVNVETALELGVDLPFALLIATDEIFYETRKPEIR